MPFIDMAAVAAATPLKTRAYPFPRAKQLEEAMSRIATDYYTRMGIAAPFEASGILLTGASRVGKSFEMRRMLGEFNNGSVVMPDGRPARIVSCILSGKVSWKDLGRQTLHAMDFPYEGRKTQSEVWELVRNQARLQGIVGIHYDECQHMFHDGARATNDMVLDCFKALMKDTTWPLMLILAGVPELETFVDAPCVAAEQLRARLNRVRFNLVRLPADYERLNRICWDFGDAVGVSMEDVSEEHFYRRLAFACAYRWGLVIELLTDALTACRLAERAGCERADFVDAYARWTGLDPSYSPFTLKDYEASFASEKLLTLIGQARDH